MNLHGQILSSSPARPSWLEASFILFIFTLTWYSRKWFPLHFISPSRIHFSGRSGYETIYLKRFISYDSKGKKSLTLSSEKFANKFPGSKVKNYFCFASIWIVKFKWLTSLLGSLFPGETGERMISLLKSLNQTAWSSAGRWGLGRSHILLSSKPYKLFIWSGRRATKGNIYGQLLLLSSFSIFPCWWRNRRGF